MKHAVIPTDFSIRSLQPVHDVISYYKNEQVQITLMHLVDIPDAIGDLLFRLRRIERHYPVPESFQHACEMIANRYDGVIVEIKPLVQYGATATYMENLLEGMRADAVFMQADFKMARTFEGSVDMISLLRRVHYKKIETAPPHINDSISQSTISDLLLAN